MSMRRERLLYTSPMKCHARGWTNHDINTKWRPQGCMFTIWLNPTYNLLQNGWITKPFYTKRYPILELEALGIDPCRVGRTLQNGQPLDGRSCYFSTSFELILRPKLLVRDWRLGRLVRFSLSPPCSDPFNSSSVNVLNRKIPITKYHKYISEF